MLPEPHAKFLELALPKIQADARILGLAIPGGWNQLDAYSDLNLVVILDSESQAMMTQDEIKGFAESLGRLLAGYAQDDDGEAAGFVCLYEEPLIHVELKLISRSIFAKTATDPLVIWERNGYLSRVLTETGTRPPAPFDLQWMEDRFWIWMHHAAMKLGQGGLFEASELLGSIRARILGPLLLQQSGKSSGSKRVEHYSGDFLPMLRSTLTGDSPHSCASALKATAKLYLELRETLASESLRRHRRAEMAAMRFLHNVLTPHPTSENPAFQEVARKH
jgi:hypothetical protein